MLSRLLFGDHLPSSKQVISKDFKQKYLLVRYAQCQRLALRSYHVSSSLRRQNTLASAISQDELNGKEVWVKDNIVTEQLPTSAGSNLLKGFKSPFEASVVRILRNHGAQITSKADLDEFGMGSHSQTSANEPVVSPFRRARLPISPGGSSGGSAVAVATDQCWAALGTDTGGSVRLPAAYLGIVGFKPSYGLLSRWGVIQYANSLDTVGILSKNVSIARQVFNILNAFDSKDPSSLPKSARACISQNQPRNRKLRIGVPIEYNIKELAPPVRAAWGSAVSALQSAGHTVESVSLQYTRQALSAYYVLAPAEASSNLAKYDAIRYGKRSSGRNPDRSLPLYSNTRGSGFGPEVKRRILLGAYSLSSEAIDNYFIQAQKVRRLVQDDFNRVFITANPLQDFEQSSKESGVDLLLTPTAPTLPPSIEEIKRQSPVEAYMNDVFTVPASLAGLPALSIPMPVPQPYMAELDAEEVKSVGMQIVGQFGSDDLVLDLGQTLQQIAQDIG